jgi:hypothetical protein
MKEPKRKITHTKSLEERSKKKMRRRKKKTRMMSLSRTVRSFERMSNCRIHEFVSISLPIKLY